MPIITPDTTEQLDFSPLEPGTYPATVTKVEADTSKKGNPMLVVYFSVEKAPGVTVQRKSWLVTSGEGTSGFDQLLRATGFADLADVYKDKSASKPAFDTDDLINQQVLVIVEQSEYNGQLRDQIKTYLKA